MVCSMSISHAMTQHELASTAQHSCSHPSSMSTFQVICHSAVLYAVLHMQLHMRRQKLISKIGFMQSGLHLAKLVLDEAHELLVLHQVLDALHDHGHQGGAALLSMIRIILLPVLVPLRRLRLRIALWLITSRLPCTLHTIQSHLQFTFLGMT